MVTPLDVPLLVRRCQAGDDAAWHELYRAHAPIVARFVTRMIGPSGATAAVDDLVQQVFIAVMRALARWRGEGSFSTWLYGIARRVTARHVRAERRRLKRDAGWAAREREVAVPAPSPDGVVWARQTLTLVEAAVFALGEAHRAVWVMRELEGLSSEEVAEALGIRVPTVRTRLFKARRLVLRALEAAEAATAASDDEVPARGVVEVIG